MHSSKIKLIYLSCFILGSTFIMAGCQKNESHHTEAQTASQPITQPAEITFNGQITNLSISLNNCSGNNCPEFSVKRLQSNFKFIDQTIEQASLDQLKQILDSSDAIPAMNKAVASTVQQSQDSYVEQVQQYADAFMSLDQELKKLSANGNISLHIEPKIIKQTPQMVVVQLSTDSFLGGAHGSASQQYFNFNLKTKQQLQLSDILEQGKEKELEKLAHDQFEKWIKRENLADSISDYEEAWAFKLSNNFYFNDKGLVLQYGEYEIGPYVVGMPSFTIGYEQLVGVVKPNYLPKNM